MKFIFMWRLYNFSHMRSRYSLLVISKTVLVPLLTLSFLLVSSIPMAVFAQENVSTSETAADTIAPTAETADIAPAVDAVQTITYGRSNRGPTMTNVRGNFDDPRDTKNIQQGINSYGKNSNSTISKSSATISNAAYTSKLSSIVKSLTAIVAAYKTLKKQDNSKDKKK